MTVTPALLTPRRWLGTIIVGGLVAAGIGILCLGVGPHAPGPLRALALLAGAEAAGKEATILFQVRLPRVLLAGAVGGAFSVAGVAFQALLRNPLADPYVLGVSSGGALGAVLALGLGLGGALGGLDAVPFAAFAGSLLALFLVTGIARTRGRLPVETLILAGVVVNFFLSALTMLVTALLPVERIPSASVWLMGSLNRALVPADAAVVGSAALAGAVALLAIARPLNALALGEEAARVVGVDPERVKRVVFLAGALLTGVAVSTAGSVGFVGLIVPHAVRFVVGPDHRVLVPGSLLAGGAFLIVADTVARSAVASEIPVGVVTALAGGPFFVWLLRTRGRRAWI